ncbi:MAG: LytTR family DNA-binding domain-containing protein, partial [Nocardioides sp.]
TVGSARLNVLALQELRQWIVGEARALVGTASMSGRNAIAGMFRELGLLAEAQQINAATAEAADEEGSYEVGQTFYNMAMVYEAQGDYARLHTPTGSHLVRTPLSTLEEEWRPAGFLRIHRSLLVALPHVGEVRMESGRCSVVVGEGTELVVSRRHTRELRDLLLRRGQ